MSSAKATPFGFRLSKLTLTPNSVVKAADRSGAWRVVGRTEKIKSLDDPLAPLSHSNSLNPVFSRQFELTYLFEEKQPLEFLLYDVDNETDSLEDDDFLGTPPLL